MKQPLGSIQQNERSPFLVGEIRGGVTTSEEHGNQMGDEPEGVGKAIFPPVKISSLDGIFRFGDLPAELRLDILDMYFAEEGSEIILKNHQPHTQSFRPHERPSFLPALLRTSREFKRDFFPYWLRSVNLVAHDVPDLIWLHRVLSAFRSHDNPKGHLYLRSLSLPHFFSDPGAIYLRKVLELSLLNKCSNLTTLRLGMSTEALTRRVCHHPGMLLRELKGLTEIISTYGFGHIFRLKSLKTLHISCYDNPAIFRHCADTEEPIRLFYALVEWMWEAYCLRLRGGVRVVGSVHGGRFCDEGEEVPFWGEVVDKEAVVGEDAVERILRRHGWLLGKKWEWEGRKMIADSSAGAVERGLDWDGGVGD
ncbi:hypothetical protein P154DRAFT_621293 [Amniculicola lignicola CBS 123094]|uniref:F-box domain-containing protein n=1 Tax=Amniculicola lignicola CBS 123094 TaxID=1392246 RepID=A0A6A5WN52_9PLEO|nr:hypothetical protein P154DRAFT_621293 [Amniculicola lignicola CBS 123094]